MTDVQTLAGKQIVVGVTGSIAAVEIVRLIHSLRRCGATVQVVMSEAAAGIISPDSLTYASGRPAITRISGMVEHVTYCGDGGSADLLLIAPCTANTISKIACGIDDTPVTTFATTALGSGMPVLVVPAMHHSMYRHPAVRGNLECLRAWGVGVVDPRIEEGKAKIADNETIVLWCERMILGTALKGKRVIITSGPCREPVDDVRVLTTRSTGLIGRALALEAFRLGAEVTVVHRDTFPCITNIFAESAADMRKAVRRCFSKDGADIYISAAAISDFAPKKYPGKIPSGKKTSLELSPLPKLLDEVIRDFAPVTVAFKIGTDTEVQARAMLRKGVTAVLTNTPATMGSRDGEYVLLAGRKKTTLKGSKDAIAHEFWKDLPNLI
ncbi:MULTISPECIES: bifunctional phosphopantothenoylcysteine decarboxylase/phosphopantothenate--cysteine ligase CoaBC [unclassified Methanoregula]|uniref:bifunctional phosphopantothenoylcysteine decarboxylase/phosphopantothenate--cysteine ligase CoaBC n=1 Tax=unclassified Methanoregula TaxID=2649730 RepID=UPI0009D564EB|nr:MULTISPECIES: bifunctional phosphopantothenoylcysteine decarboxylase/phosphopantothenate--cysteine ligase CoaBC [unclassified Methanoregula]OPX65187.1 MAG: bifunctional phosphopantothenoylcysteine decarboxylase/phosphopantothenate synthase [Methanoregula sp. PtaB.Bin085]OPY32096.1 MAG: bifunctional phosphopantothenoylcysteine decarboxylase/phosphopantothenate synthase [Methanoregula sp. PtaU1.Bin006]